ncbi:MAG TPA: dephospho-CoA kinase [Actinomycetota bacterium]|nr:dephospho-CoA kinase [Actinomycetota bacterium]
MLLVGLTGGIGAGKSTVAELLAHHGAVILDADAFARDAVRAGTDALGAVVRRFGDEVLGPDGELDRARLAAIVFADREALGDLEAIIHPEVRRMIADGIGSHLDTDHVVVLVNPLLIEMGTHRDCDVVVVVSASRETQVARSVARGMDEADVRSRIDAQLPLDARAQAADVLLDNEGTREELEAEVEVLWNDLAARAADGR